MIRPDDPRLTAYVVDEADEATRADVETALAGSAELRDESAEIADAASLLSEALAEEPTPVLLPEQRQRIEQAARPERRLAPWVWVGLAAAALVAAVALLLRAPAPVPPPPPTATASAGPSPTKAAEVTVTAPVPSKAPARRRSTTKLALPSPAADVTVALSAPAARTAAVQGQVEDQTGATIPGVSITATEQQTGRQYVGSTDKSGQYGLDGLPAGSYTLRAELSGFKAAVTPPFELQQGQGEERDLVLAVGTLTETTEVVGAELGGVVTGSQVVELPLNGRNFAQLPLLVYDGVNVESEPSAGFNREAYAHRPENDYLAVAQHPLSTFSVDVDTASYANVRRFLNEGQRPPAGAVRLEEMVNYFPYDYAGPRGKEPFAAHFEVTPAPWNAKHRLLRIGIKAREITSRPAGNLVFLIDVSGSMNEPNKLPLVKQSLALLVDQLSARDQVAIVVYAGAAGLVLPPTPGDQKRELHAALERLEAGGSTNGGQGIQLAYDLAARHFIRGGVNRVILATDGDFNVGITDEGSLVRLIEQKAKTGVFLSVFGFGMGNYQDDRLESLADKGNGNYGYIDTINEARKALVEQTQSTLVTVAKDVKLQIEFNPTRVQAYRLLGYENRLLRPEDFKDDQKDAGEVGAGHAVTALYELVPAGAEPKGGKADALAYQAPGRLTAAARSGELARLKLRYKEPEGNRSRPMEWKVRDEDAALASASADFKLAAAVAGFGMLLQDSPHKGQLTLDDVLRLGEEGLGPDRFGYRAEFLELVRRAKALPAADPAQVTPPEP
jgi:Ca-activated chloride channel homolog